PDTVDWELIKEWLHKCHAEHDNNYCNAPKSVTAEDIPSFCVIDCETETIIPAAGMRNLKYVTLSYIWGASTTPSQVPVASTSLPVLPESNQRPKVVNDAMEVVQRIGYRYLWVDRYCIPQSDHDAKSIQIQKMGKIYSLSALTIIAAAGNDAEYGLPGVSSPPTLQPLWTTIRSGKREMPVIYFEPPNKDILRSTWNSRGWTYQEALLSRRRLVFTDRHVYFQCESMQSIGGLPSRHPDELPLPADGSAVFPFRRYYGTSLWGEDFIWDLINEYAKRTLSFEQDSIHAVQGILESFRDKCDVFFFYGLPILEFSDIFCDLVDYQNDSTVPNVLTITAGTFWEVDFNRQAIFGSLLWRDNWCNTTVATHLNQETMFSDQIKLRKMGFPSWTWAGWETAKNKVTFKGERDKVYEREPDYYVPEGFPLEIRVSYDGKSLAWLGDIEEILRRSKNISEFPDFLIISGPVFDVSMSCKNAEDQRTTGHPTGPIVWRYTSPPFLAYPGVLPYVGPPCSIDGIGGNIMNLIALCVFSNISEDSLTFRMLILRPVGEDAHGHVYERLT
ncbi:heterokaryon incompatibility protein-domain-containing protein, partial [Neurospora crassa]